MRVLVTGHEGYVGSVVVRVLHDAGHEAVGLDTSFFGGCTMGPEPLAVPARRVDVRDADADDLDHPDAVVHLAALSNDALGRLDPALTYDINHRAAVTFAAAARRAGVKRFVFASSCSLYGAASSDEVLDESAAFAPITSYGESKVLAERDISALADDDFSPTFLRFATMYGPSPRLRLDLVVNDLVAHALVAGEVALQSDGTPWRPLIHVDDAAAGILAALEAPRAAVHDEAFNVGATTENVQVRAIAEVVADEVPGSTVTSAPGAGPDPRSYRVDFTKATERLPGFRTRWKLRDGVQQLVDVFQRHGLGREDLASSRFVRLRRIEELRNEDLLGPDLRWRHDVTGR